MFCLRIFLVLGLGLALGARAQVPQKPSPLFTSRETVEPWMAKLDQAWAGYRRAGAWALGQLGPGAERAIPRLIRTLSDPDRRLRWEAAFALCSIGSKAVPALEKVLHGSELRSCLLAAWVLGKLGPTGRPALRILRARYLHPQSPRVLRETAFWAFERVLGRKRDAWGEAWHEP